MHFSYKIILSLFILISCPLPIFSANTLHADSKEHMVIDPVSNGETYVYEAGMENDVSIILIHGLGDEGSLIWRDLIPELVTRYHVVTFDLPGFGRSSKQNILYSPLFYARFIQWVKDRYVKNRSFIVIGHSLGGSVALAYGAGQPDNLQRLILVDVSGIIHRLDFTKHIINNMYEEKENLLNFPAKVFGVATSGTVDKMESPELSASLDKILESPELRDRYLDGNSHTIAGLALANFDFSELIYNIDVPTVIIWGENDPITSLRTGRLLSYIIDKTQFHVIPEAGHNPIVGQSAEFNSIVKAALMTESWQLPRKNLAKKDRVALISGKRDLELTGYYKSIELSGCKGISLKNVEAESVKIVDSADIVIENSRINGKDVALNVQESIVTLTGVQLSADNAIVTSGSVMDLAGVTIRGNKAAVQAVNGSKLLFSVSKIESPYNKGYIHGFYLVVPEKPL